MIRRYGPDYEDVESIGSLPFEVASTQWAGVRTMEPGESVELDYTDAESSSKYEIYREYNKKSKRRKSRW